MNLDLKEYIDTVTSPKLSYHVKYSEFFEKQFEKFTNELVAINNKNKPICFYCWKREIDEFDKLVEGKKLTYKGKVIGEDDNWEYLIDYSAAFEKGFNSLNDQTPPSVVINNVPFCAKQNCINPEDTANKIICLGRKNSKSKLCIAGMRPISPDTFFGNGILRSLNINYMTSERILKDPQKTGFKEGLMFKSIFLVIERYLEFRNFFVFETPESKQIFIDDIDSFVAVREISPGMVSEMIDNKGYFNVSEEDVKLCLEGILTEPFHKLDWGGEYNDMYSTNLIFNGKRMAVAFLLKGNGLKYKTMEIKHCGKNGDQLVRLFESPAEVFIIQFVGNISESIIKDIKGKVELISSKGKTAFYCIINGQDTARLLKAYTPSPHIDK